MVFGVNLYVQSAGTRARIESGLGAALHAPVKIGGVSFMPWYGVRISGITRDDEAAAAEGDTLEIGAVSVRLRLWRLMRGEVVIKKVTVDDVKAALTQNSEGKWQMPAGAVPAAAESPAQPETPAGTPQPAAAEQTPPPGAKSRPVIVNDARMRNGSFTFYDKKHRPIAAFTGVYVEAPSPTDQLVEGMAEVLSVAVQKEFFIDDWMGKFKYTPEELSLFDTSCKVAGGDATGTLDVKIAEPDSPFALDTKFSGVSLEKLLGNAGVTQVQASGMISGFMHLEGDLRDSAHARGKGEIVLANGFITQSELFESLGAWLGTNQFRGLPLQDAHAIFHVEGGKVYLDDLTLKSPVLAFTSKGVMAADGSGLYLLCRIAISADVARQIPDSDYLLQNFAKDETTGARYVDFPITGDINHPDESAFRNTVGKHINLKSGMNELLNYLGGKHGKPPPAATPAPAPQQPAPPNP